MHEVHSYDPAQGHGLPHNPIKAIVAPRPIGWISTRDAEGRVNLAPYSFFNIFSDAPPIIAFGSDGEKHSVANARATGEFVFNLATFELAEAMNLTSGSFAAGHDEMAAAGLEAAPSDVVGVPRVARSPAALECRVLDIHRLHDLAGRDLDSYMVLGQVVRVHIHRSALKDGIFDIAAVRPIARCGYRGDYAVVDETFQMIRPA